ncbi:MAG: hypothetical protein EGS78_06075 [Bacteroidales bacterium]|nr:hypothetical protein [Bacteroidales bacterium]
MRHFSIFKVNSVLDACAEHIFINRDSGSCDIADSVIWHWKKAFEPVGRRGSELPWRRDTSEGETLQKQIPDFH